MTTPAVATPVSAAAIRIATGPADLARARALFEEYAAWLAVDLCFQGFAGELASLPGTYAPPGGRLLLAGTPDDAFGCAALRPLAAASSGGGVTPGAPAAGEQAGEVKRLYVQPRARGQGWGRRLAARLIDEARTIGYTALYLDTLERMEEARGLYASLGFVRCPPYYHNPLGDTVYMRLALASRR